MELPGQLTANVSQQHIDGGERKNCDACPVALAFNEALPPEMVANATLFCILVYRRDDHELLAKYRLPDEAARFVAHYDQDLAVKPLTVLAERLPWPSF